MPDLEPVSELPELYAVRQSFDDTKVGDVRTAVHAACKAAGVHRRIRPGQRVAITAGSRGIDRIRDLLGATAEVLRSCGAEPFVLAAMGSHGGATDAGQLAVLRGYGITEEAVSCPVRACVRSREVGALSDGTPVLCSELACSADAVVVANRVKPHTILTGEQGSGLMKMAAVGLGGPAGADTIHARGLSESMLPSARVVLERLPVCFGLAIVENAFDRVCHIEAVDPCEFEAADRRLLARARALLPRIPFDPVDVLVVRRMGKNISGAGMDPNVIGMHRRLGGAPNREIGRIVVLELAPESHGNAIGVGMADIITRRLHAAIDWEATYANGLTSGFFAGIKLPVALPTDREAIGAALKGLAPDRVRLVVIEDTAHLAELYVSGALVPKAKANDRLVVADHSQRLEFGPDGAMVAPAFRPR